MERAVSNPYPTPTKFLTPFLPVTCGISRIAAAGSYTPQKWLRAGHPIGIAVAPRDASREWIVRVAAEFRSSGDAADPLLDFVDQVARDEAHPYGETADVGAMFCLAAAIQAALSERCRVEERFRFRLANGARVREIAREVGWEPIELTPAFRSGIQLIRATDATLRALHARCLRSELHRRGVVATVYEGGIVRLSLLGQLWDGDDLILIRSVLRPNCPHRSASQRLTASQRLFHQSIHANCTFRNLPYLSR